MEAEEKERQEQPQGAPAEAPAQAGAAAEGVEELKGRLEDERAKAEKYLANWQRAEADFANYKRRSEQERDEQRRLANASLIINILPIVDDLERALASLDIRLVGLTWFDGIRLIHRKLQLVLENAGVSVIAAEGQPFDPRFHEAIQYAEGEEGKVLAEVQRGYKLYDRVLRPAMVIVGKGKGEGPPSEGEAKGEGGQENPEGE